MLIDKDDATLLVVDVQQKLLPAVLDPQGMLARCRWLVSAAHDVGLPVVFSEENVIKLCCYRCCFPLSARLFCKVTTVWCYTHKIAVVK